MKLLTDYAVNGLDKPGIITANALFLPNYCKGLVLHTVPVGQMTGMLVSIMLEILLITGVATGNVVWADAGVRLLSTDPYLNPSERTNINLFVNYEIADDLNARLEMYKSDFSAQGMLLNHIFLMDFSQPLIVLCKCPHDLKMPKIFLQQKVLIHFI